MMGCPESFVRAGLYLYKYKLEPSSDSANEVNLTSSSGLEVSIEDFKASFF